MSSSTQANYGAHYSTASLQQNSGSGISHETSTTQAFSRHVSPDARNSIILISAFIQLHFIPILSKYKITYIVNSESDVCLWIDGFCLALIAQRMHLWLMFTLWAFVLCLMLNADLLIHSVFWLGVTCTVDRALKANQLSLWGTRAVLNPTPSYRHFLLFQTAVNQFSSMRDQVNKICPHEFFELRKIGLVGAAPPLKLLKHLSLPMLCRVRIAVTLHLPDFRSILTKFSY